MLRVVLCNCSPEESDELARGIVDNGLAACVNTLEGVQSRYEWRGDVCQETEHTLLIKTSASRYPDLKDWIEEHHSYDVPEIVSLEAADVLEAYEDWVLEQTGADR